MTALFDEPRLSARFTGFRWRSHSTTISYRVFDGFSTGFQRVSLLPLLITAGLAWLITEPEPDHPNALSRID